MQPLFWKLSYSIKLTVHGVFFCCCMDRAGTCIDCPELNDQLASLYYIYLISNTVILTPL